MNKYIDIHNKKALILTGIAIFTLLAFIFSATYAYFIASENLLTTTRTLDVVTNDTISVAATGNTTLSMDLNLDDMRKFGESKTYYATKEGKTETPSKEQFVNIESNSSKEIYCTYTISLTNNDTTGYSNMIDQIKANGKENELKINFYVNNNDIKTYDMKTAECTDDKIRFSGIINNIEPLAQVGIDVDLSLSNLEEVDQATYLALSALNLSLKLEEINCDSTEAPKIESIAVNNTFLNSLDVTMNDGTYELAAYCVDQIARSKGECEWTVNNDKTFSVPINVPSNGIYYLHVKDIRGYIADSAGFDVIIDNNIAVNDFEYKNSEQKLDISSGVYKLEVWGAQGGTGSSYNGIGGYGGYAVGIFNSSKSNTLFIHTGGKGGAGGAAGYNGGGTGGDSGHTGAGGGATHIALTSGLLNTLSSTENQQKVLIVAGGGGGMEACWGNGYILGMGGGFEGSRGFSSQSNGYGTGGTQSNAGNNVYNGNGYGSFGQGGNGSSISTCSSGGGGGWYGGGAAYGGNAGGGSGYIGGVVSNDEVTRSMYCYGCPTTDVENIKTIQTAITNIAPTENTAKQNHGYARITKIRSVKITLY